MNKGKASLILTMALMSFSPAFATSLERLDSEDLNRIKNWSINAVYKPLGKLGGADPSSHIPDYRYSYKPDDPQKPYFVYLNRLDDSEKVVSVFQAKSEVKLNPRRFFKKQGFDYGPIPEIYKISEQEADCLWGRGIKISDNFRAYHLKTKNPYFGRDVFLEVEFNDGHISKYRIKCTNIDSTSWIEENEGGWIFPILLLATATSLGITLLPKRLPV